MKSVGHIADFSPSLMMSRYRRRPSSSSSSSELEMVMSAAAAAAVGVQHVRVGISRLIRRLITLLIHRSRHYSLVLLVRVLVVLLWLMIVAVR